MDKINDGGPAFPLTDAQSVHRIGAAAIEGIADSAERDRLYIEATARARAGVSLRDYFAAKALQGLLADPSTNVPINSADPEFIEFEQQKFADVAARAAYRMADAMLRARGEA
ncbi:hypothetical protein [Burkholderia ambifaria]|jgi:hypothetical protein|uniref:hypothetical protein n=1 Tax=Burkholderia ambifaria TaxID=152480 RepID=UPI001589D301|nr:hypothetical protein [Burkholderia ambifaria]